MLLHFLAILIVLLYHTSSHPSSSSSCRDPLPYISFTTHPPSRRHPPVVVVMADNRPLIAPTRGRATPSQHAAAINAAYARTNGYDFRWFLSPCVATDSCFYDDHHRSNRYASWAKLIAINQTLFEYAARNIDIVVLFIDSDAFISNHSLRLSHMSSNAAMAAWEDEVPQSLCSGIVMVRNSEAGMALVNRWWTAEMPDKSRQSLLWWEQRVLNNVIVRDYACSIAMLPSAGFASSSKTYWDSGVLLEERMQRSVHEGWTETELAELGYVSFVRHMWAGALDRHPHVVAEAWRGVGAPLLRRADLETCGTSPHMLCLIQQPLVAYG